MEIVYDKEIEVTFNQYRILSKFYGVLAHREYKGRYFIKIWLMEYVDQVKQVIKTVN